MKNILFFLFCILSIGLQANKPSIGASKEAKAKEFLKNQPLEFIENKGQFCNTEGKLAENVLFKTTYGNCDIYITDKGLSYVFVKMEEDGRPKTDDRKEEKMDPNIMFGEKGNKKVSYYRLDMNLEGATISKANIIKEEESKQGHSNYFYAHCPQGIYDVKAYGKITIKNIYKGIDWVIYTNANSKDHPLKYDFVVHPGAEYKAIQIKFLNAQSTSLTDNDTKLKIQTIAGNIEEGNLYSYLMNEKLIRKNEKFEIGCKYAISKDTIISFEIADYDSSKTLVIDPLVWATYYGGSGHDFFALICVDSQDNIYITGHTMSTNFPIQQLTGAYWQPTLAGGGYYNCIILKFNNHGVRQWSTFYGGEGDDFGHSICVDSQDNIYITGSAWSAFFPTQQLSGAYWQPIKGLGHDCFILKFNNQGVRQWATFYGGSGNEGGNSICVDSQDNIYITGSTSSINFPTQQLTGAFWQPTNGGSTDIFILRFNNLGVRQWATYYGGSGIDGADFYGIGTWNISSSNIRVDSLDNIYISDKTTSTNFPTQQLTGAYWQPTNGGGLDIFILKFNNLGVRQWATYYGGSGDDVCYSICIDSQDNIYMTGYTYSYNFPTQQLLGAYWQPTNGGYWILFILRFNNMGVRQWATYYGGSSGEMGNSICVDNLDNIYITGKTYSPDFPTQQLTGEYNQTTIFGSSDAFILKFDDQGSRQWATFYGSNNDEFYSHFDFGSGIAVDGENSIYFIGELSGQNAYTVNYGNGSYYDNSWYGDHSDAYILKIRTCYNKKPTSVQTDRNNLCISDNGNITLTAIGGAGNTLKWYTGSCGQIYIGNNTTITIPSPTQTTTYYARWESVCDTSLCENITIYVTSVIHTNLNPILCQGGIFHVGSHNYFMTGIYQDTLITYWGCDSIITTNLTVKPIMHITINPSICQGDIYQIGTHTYTTTGTYTDTISSFFGCDSIVTTHLTVGSIKQTTINPVICQGNIFQVGTNTYTISGTYIDSLTTFLGCDSIITTNLIVNPTKTTTLNPVICQGEIYQLVTHIYTIAGTYSDTLTTYLGCDSVVIINLTVNPLPIINLGNDVTICQGTMLVLDATIANAAYLWQDSSYSPTHNVTQQGMYWVKTTIDSCSSMDSINIIIEDCEIILEIPNFFSPNYDNINDVFLPFKIKGIESMNTNIYNRWGTLIFTSDELSINWDGKTNKGDKVADGVYYWIVNYTDRNNKKSTKMGSVTVLR